jgi:hypothetical protein
MRSRYVAAVVMAAGLLVAGCSTTAVLDLAKLEREILDRLRDAFPDADLGEVDCPSEVKVEQGDTFRCTVEIDGQTLPFRVRQTDADGNVEFEPTKATIDLRLAERRIGELLADRASGELTVDCGRRSVLVADPGDTFDCEATDDSGSVTVTGTVTNIEGEVDFETQGSGGETVELSFRTLERSIKAAFLEAFPGTSLGALVCDSDTVVEVGSTFECVLDVEGQDLGYAVTVNNADGDVDFEPLQAPISVDKAAGAIAAELGVGVEELAVDCGGGPILVVAVGDTFDCEVSGAETLTVRFTVNDVEGNVTFVSL